MRWHTDNRCRLSSLAVSGLTGFLRDALCSALVLGNSEMSLGTVVLIVMVLLLIGACPVWPCSRTWGYGPSDGLWLVLMILFVLWLI